MKKVVRSSLAAETCSMAMCMEQLDWMRTLESDDDCRPQFGRVCGC